VIVAVPNPRVLIWRTKEWVGISAVLTSLVVPQSPAYG